MQIKRLNKDEEKEKKPERKLRGRGDELERRMEHVVNKRGRREAEKETNWKKRK